MAAHEAALAVLALAVGLALAWRSSSPGGRVLLFGSALLIAGLLFLPGSQLQAIVGRESFVALRRLGGMTPWPASDWVHFFIFVWLGLLLWLFRADLRGWKAWLLVIALAVASEFAQGLAPGREGRLDDVLLNLAGGMVGILLGIGWLKLRRPRVPR